MGEGGGGTAVKEGEVLQTYAAESAGGESCLDAETGLPGCAAVAHVLNHHCRRHAPEGVHHRLQHRIREGARIVAGHALRGEGPQRRAVGSDGIGGGIAALVEESPRQHCGGHPTALRL